MTPHEKRMQIQSMAQTDHEIITHSIANFRKLFRGELSLQANEEFAAIQHVLTDKLTEHFAYEEQHLFPLIATEDPGETTTLRLTELREEHAMLLTELQHVKALLGQRPLAKVTGEIWTALQDFFTMVQQHAAKEERLFADLG